MSLIPDIPDQFAKKLFNPLFGNIKSWGEEPTQAKKEKEKYLAISIVIGLGTVGLAHLAYGTVRLAKNIKKLLQSDTPVKTTITKEGKISVKPQELSPEEKIKIDEESIEGERALRERLFDEGKSRAPQLQGLNKATENLFSGLELNPTFVEKFGQPQWEKNKYGNLVCTLYIKQGSEDERREVAERKVEELLRENNLDDYRIKVNSELRGMPPGTTKVTCSIGDYSAQALSERIKPLSRDELNKASTFFKQLEGLKGKFHSVKFDDQGGLDLVVKNNESLEEIKRHLEEKFPNFEGFSSFTSRTGEKQIVIHGMPLRAFYYQHIKEAS